MSSINISEDDFETVARAAVEANDRGDSAEAAKLDKIARKINASLTNANAYVQAGKAMGFATRKKFTWRDVPSTIVDPNRLQEIAEAAAVLAARLKAQNDRWDATPDKLA